MKIILFGANRDGKQVLRSLKPHIWSDQIEVIAFIDNDTRIEGTEIEGIPVHLPSYIQELSFDKVIVCPIFNEEMIAQLRTFGVPTEKIECNYSEEYFSRKKRSVGNITMGRFSYAKPSTLLINAEIGDFCHIGDGCVIGQLGHRVDLVSTYPLDIHVTNKNSDPTKDSTANQELLNRKTVIKNDVYIGEGAIIKAGVTVGNGAVIASRAYVTKDVPDYAVMGGLPAKVLKLRFSEKQIENLRQISWWNWDEEKIKRNAHLINGDLGDFVDAFLSS